MDPTALNRIPGAFWSAAGKLGSAVQKAGNAASEKKMRAVKSARKQKKKTSLLTFAFKQVRRPMKTVARPNQEHPENPAGVRSQVDDAIQKKAERKAKAARVELLARTKSRLPDFIAKTNTLLDHATNENIGFESDRGKNIVAKATADIEKLEEVINLFKDDDDKDISTLMAKISTLRQRLQEYKAACTEHVKVASNSLTNRQARTSDDTPDVVAASRFRKMMPRLPRDHQLDEQFEMLADLEKAQEADARRAELNDLIAELEAPPKTTSLTTREMDERDELQKELEILDDRARAQDERNASARDAYRRNRVSLEADAFQAGLNDLIAELEAPPKTVSLTADHELGQARLETKTKGLLKPDFDEFARMPGEPLVPLPVLPSKK